MRQQHSLTVLTNKHRPLPRQRFARFEFEVRIDLPGSLRCVSAVEPSELQLVGRVFCAWEFVFDDVLGRMREMIRLPARHLYLSNIPAELSTKQGSWQES